MLSLLKSSHFFNQTYMTIEGMSVAQAERIYSVLHFSLLIEKQ